MKKFILLFLLLYPLFSICQSKKKLALVIGVSNYKNVSRLENPVNDARLIVSTLKEVDFDVMLKEDVNKRDLTDIIKVFSKKLVDSNYEVGFFYFAGHGIQVENTNFLVPSDANIDSVNDKYEVEEQCYSVQRLMSYFNSERFANKVLITVLDACRNNPFNKNRSISDEGLAKSNAVSGSLIAYSTEPGKIALDGKGRANSIYCEVLSKCLKMPNLTLEEVFKSVRTEVEKQTNFRQSPREESALKGAPFYFVYNRDNNKVDISQLENEFYYFLSNHNYEKSISKGNFLKNIYKEQEDLIGMLNYIKTLIDMGNLYYLISEDSSRKEDWHYYYKLGSNDLIEAINRIKITGFKSRLHQYYYSKALINFLIFQINLGEEDRIYTNDQLLKLAQELVDFNRTKFAENNYVNACSYYVNGLANVDSNFIKAYEYCNKAYQYFKYDENKPANDSNYFFNTNMRYKTIKWNLKTLNLIINSSDTNNVYIKNLLLNNPDSFYIKSKFYFEQDLKFIDKYTKSDMNEFLDDLGSFYNGYSDYINNEFGMNLKLDALNIYDKLLNYSQNYEDSIDAISAWCNSAIEIIVAKKQPETSRKKLIEDLEYRILQAIDLAFKNNDNLYITFSLSRYFYYLTQLLNANIYFLNKKKVEPLLDKLYSYFPTLIVSYKNLTEPKKKFISNQLNLLYSNIRHIFENIDSIDFKYKKIEADQTIEFYANSIYDGYGSPAYLAALEHRAVVWENSDDINLKEESKVTYINLITLIQDFSKSWTPLSISGCFNGSSSKEECIANLLSDVYNNYSNNILFDSSSIKSPKDSILFYSFQDFVNSNQVALKNINKYYSTLSTFYQLSSVYFQSLNTLRSLDNCDSGIAQLNKRLLLDSVKSNEDFISRYRSEQLLLWFFNKKLDLLKKIDFKKYDREFLEFEKKIRAFQDYDITSAQLELLNTVTSDYFYVLHDYKKTKITSFKSIGLFKTFIKSDKYLNKDYNKNWKLYNLDLIRSILAIGVEGACNPTFEERKNVISICNFIIDFINSNWSNSEVESDNYICKTLMAAFNTASDLSYFNKDYESAIIFNKKSIEFMMRSKKFELDEIDNYKNMASSYIELKDTINAYNAYINALSIEKHIDTTIKNNFSYSFDTLNYNNCNYTFLHIKLLTPKNSWPCFEFDVNNNLSIDSNLDIRYYLDTNNVLKVEKIKSISEEIGGYKILGVINGRTTDTSRDIYFDNSEKRKTNAYYFLKELIINDEISYGGLNKGEKINFWDFYIPTNEIIMNKENVISFIYSNVYKNTSEHTLSRRFNKVSFPLRSNFWGFKEKYKISN